MNFLHFIFTVFLFVVLTPAIFVRLPPKGNKWIVALVHGIVFATIYYLSNHFLFRRLEGLTNIDDIHDLSLNKHDVSGNLTLSLDK